MPEFQFDGLADFLSMGGYGFYVWASYGFFAVVMGLNLWLPRVQRRQLMRLLRARMARDQQDPHTQDPHKQQMTQQQQGDQPTPVRQFE